MPTKALTFRVSAAVLVAGIFVAMWLMLRHTSDSVSPTGPGRPEVLPEYRIPRTAQGPRLVELSAPSGFDACFLLDLANRGFGKAHDISVGFGAGGRLCLNE